jgi:transposase
MVIFFDIFRRPTVQAQAKLYPTLHNVLPNYLYMLRQLNVHKAQDDKPSLKAAAKAAHKILSDYYKKALTTRYSFVAIICDPRYKLSVLAFMFNTEGGDDSPLYKKGKAHFEHVYS